MGRDPCLTSTGAVLEAGVVRHFGAPDAEWAAARSSAGLFDRRHRDRLLFEGPDAASFLNRLLSYNVLTMDAGGGARPFLLDATGRIQGVMHLRRLDAERFHADCTAGHGAELLERLDLFFFGERLQMTAVEGRACLAVQGPAAAEVLAAVDLPRPERPWQHTAATLAGCPVRVARVDLMTGAGYEIDLPGEGYRAAFEALRAAGARPAGEDALECLRVEAARARHPNELGPHCGPIEAGADDGYSEGKGCYPGQEVIERTLAIGRPARRSLALQLDADAAPGEALWVEDREVGALTSVAALPDGRRLALALVKRRHATATAVFRAAAGATARARPPCP